MKTNGYLYGEGVEVPQIPTEIIKGRVDLLNIHLSNLLDSGIDRDRLLQNELKDAIKFWETINFR